MDLYNERQAKLETRVWPSSDDIFMIETIHQILQNPHSCVHVRYEHMRLSRLSLLLFASMQMKNQYQQPIPFNVKTLNIVKKTGFHTGNKNYFKIR